MSLAVVRIHIDFPRTATPCVGAQLELRPRHTKRSPLRRRAGARNHENRVGVVGFELTTSGTQSTFEKVQEQSIRGVTDHASRDDDSGLPLIAARGQNSRTEPAGAAKYLLDAALADELLHVALGRLAERVAGSLAPGA